MCEHPAGEILFDGLSNVELDSVEYLNIFFKCPLCGVRGISILEANKVEWEEDTVRHEIFVVEDVTRRRKLIVRSDGNVVEPADASELDYEILDWMDNSLQCKECGILSTADDYAKHGIREDWQEL